jgi:hypothetical protein
MGFIRFVFYVVLGYMILRLLNKLFRPKRKPVNRDQKSDGYSKKENDPKLNTDGIGDYIDYEEVK